MTIYKRPSCLLHSDKLPCREVGWAWEASTTRWIEHCESDAELQSIECKQRSSRYYKISITSGDVQNYVTQIIKSIFHHHLCLWLGNFTILDIELNLNLFILNYFIFKVFCLDKITQIYWILIFFIWIKYFNYHQIQINYLNIKKLLKIKIYQYY